MLSGTVAVLPASAAVATLESTRVATFPAACVSSCVQPAGGGAVTVDELTDSTRTSPSPARTDGGTVTDTEDAETRRSADPRNPMPVSVPAGAVTVTVEVRGPVAPSSSVTVRVTWYVPGAA